MLKKLGLASVIGLLAAPAMAADLDLVEPVLNPPAPEQHILTGHLEMAVGLDHATSGSNAVGVIEGAGRFNIAFGQGWNVQVDLNVDGFFDDMYSDTITYPLAHLWRGSETHAFGAFGGVGFGLGSALFIAGVEGEAYFGNTAIGGQAAYNFSSNLDYGIGKFTNLRGWLKHYFTPDLKATGEVQATLFSGDGPGGTLWSASAALEKRHTGSPLSGFVEGRYTSFQGGCCSSSSWQGMIGFRLFGDQPGSTLYDHDMRVPWSYNLIPSLGGAG